MNVIYSSVDWSSALPQHVQQRAARYPDPRGVVVSSIRVFWDNKWQHLFTYCKYSQNEPEALVLNGYPQARLIRRTFSVEQFENSLLPNLPRDGLGEGLNTGPVQGGIDRWTAEQAGPNGENLHGLFFKAKKNLLPSWFNGPITGRAVSPFQDLEHLVKTWSQCRTWSPTWAFKNGVGIEYSDTRGVLFQPEPSPEKPDRLFVPASLLDVTAILWVIGTDGQGEKHPTRAERVDDGFEVAWHPSWKRAELLLQDMDGDLLYQRSVDGLPSTTNDDEEEELELLIARGESRYVELKSWTVATKRDGKSRSKIVKSVGAFANTDGGTLLIGISDETGLEDGVFAEEATFEEQRAALRNVQEAVSTLTPGPPVEFRIARKRGHAVIVCRVKSGDEKPYVDLSGVTYVRAGASSRPTSREELLHLVKHGDWRRPA